MCDRAIEFDPCMLCFIPDHYKTREVCNKAFKVVYDIQFIPEKFITQEMCDKACELDYDYLILYINNNRLKWRA